MNSLMKALLLTSIWALSSQAANNVVFIGLHGNGAPAVEKTFDRLLREHISVIPNIHAVDYLQTQRYRNQIDFAQYPTVSRTLVEDLITIAGDSTLFIWGMVKTYRIFPVRKNLLWAKLKGELEIGLNMYSLATHEYAYVGTIKAEFYKPKGYAGFGSIQKEVHISALDRTEILEQLEYEAVRISGRMITAVLQSDRSGGLPSGNSDVESYRVPSISDVFSIPSMDAPVIESGDLGAGSDEIQTDSVTPVDQDFQKEAQ